MFSWGQYESSSSVVSSSLVLVEFFQQEPEDTNVQSKQVS